jgi:ethanolamine permease
VLALAAVVATVLVVVVAALCALGAFALLMAYFGFYSRHHLVASAPDEEFAALADAEAELEGSSETTRGHER